MSRGARAMAIAFLRAPALSSAGFLRGAFIIAILFGAAHAAGLREHTLILSGSTPPGDSGHAATVLGLTYVLLYFAFVLGAPILVIASGLLFALDRAMKGRSPQA